MKKLRYFILAYFFACNIPTTAKPIQDLTFAYIAEGIVVNEDTDVGIANAEVIITNTADKEVFKLKTNAQGKFEVLLQPNRDYEITANHYHFLSLHSFQIETVEYRKIYMLRLPLKEIYLGKALLVEKINFQVNDTTFTKKTYPALEKFYEILSTNQSIIVEIAVHTDSRGSDEYNLQLSQQRADYIVKYLISRNIPQSRLTGKGYGETHLANGCANGIRCSGTDHELNRRVEFVVRSLVE